MILVTGASGKIGSEAVRLLAAAGRPTRALVRDRAKAPGDVEVALGDFERPDTLDAAMRKVDTVLLVSPSTPAHEIAVIDSAARHGVEHIIKVTNHRATTDSPVARRRDHAEIEAHLASSGLSYTLLAPNLFMQNLLMLAPSITRTRSFSNAAGDGRFAMIDARDVAAVAATVAAEPRDHAGRTYLLTGSALITFGDVADALTATLGQTVTYHQVTPDEQRDAQVRAGLPAPVAASNAQVFALISEGDTEWITDTVESITGTPPRTLEAFLGEHVTYFT